MLSHIVVLIISVVLINTIKECESISSEDSLHNNETMHIFLVLVRNPDINKIHKYRQEDEDGGGGAGSGGAGGGVGGEAAAAAVSTFAQTGQNLGQLIQGVLTGNIAHVFAGTVKFIDADSPARQGLGTLFGAISPALNLVLREAYLRTQVAFGFATTPNPALQPSPTYQSNSSSNSITNYQSNNPTMYGNNGGIQPQPGRPLNLQRLPPQRVQQAQAPQPPKPTTSWQYVLNQLYGSTTTVEPLPLLTRPTRVASTIDEDDNENDDLILRRILKNRK